VTERARKLEEVVEVYQALRLCCTEAMEYAHRNNSWSRFAEKLQKNTGKTVGDTAYSDHGVKKLFDDHVMRILDEVCFLDLVRAFERIVFDLVDTASGEIKKAAKGKTKYPFYLCAERFVKSPADKDISNLGHVQKMLEGHLAPDLHRRFDEIVRYRNWLAHGNRFKDPKDRPSRREEVSEALEILSEILANIKHVV